MGIFFPGLQNKWRKLQTARAKYIASGNIAALSFLKMGVFFPRFKNKQQLQQSHSKAKEKLEQSYSKARAKLQRNHSRATAKPQHGCHNEAATA